MFAKLLAFFGINKQPRQDFGKRSILIVDDNLADLRLMQRTIEKMGHLVLTAENGKDGFALAKKEKPDLILSDCRMPEMDGVEMCKWIKEDEETKRIPLVFLTGVDSPNTIVECFDMGVDNYMCKPINPKLLTDQITAIFNEYLAS